MEGSYPGFGYPLYELLSPYTLGSLFQLPTLLGFSLQSFSPPQGSVDPFEPTSPLLHFLKKPLGLVSTLQRVSPTEKAVPLFATQRFSPGQGHLLSWDLRVSQALSPGKSSQRSSPPPGSPLTLRSKRPLNLLSLKSQGLRSFLARLLPRKGAGLLDLSDPNIIHLFESRSAAAYFFSSRALNPLRSSNHSLFATTPKSS